MGHPGMGSNPLHILTQKPTDILQSLTTTVGETKVPKRTPVAQVNMHRASSIISVTTPTNYQTQQPES